MPPKAQPSQQHLAIIKYTGAPEDVPVSKWLRLFETKADALDWTDNEKVKSLCDYLEGEAFRWYLSEIFEVCETWEEVKQSMTVRFGAAVLDPFRSFIHCRQKREQSVREYYEEKRRLGESAGLSTPHVIAGLTDGLLPELERRFVGTEPKSPLEWLNIAQKFEHASATAPPPTFRGPQGSSRGRGRTQGHPAAGDAPSSRTATSRHVLPRTECRHCVNIGLSGQFHWQNACPYRPTVSAITEDQGNGEGDPR